MFPVSFVSPFYFSVVLRNGYSARKDLHAAMQVAYQVS
jgi:hypothetical protein